jgi:hypothetical protein
MEPGSARARARARRRRRCRSRLGQARVELELGGRRVKAGEKRWLQHDDGDLRAGMGRWPARLGLVS